MRLVRLAKTTSGSVIFTLSNNGIKYMQKHCTKYERIKFVIMIVVAVVVVDTRLLKK